MGFQYLVLFLLSALAARVNSQLCYRFSAQDRCSSNNACACLRMEDVPNIGVCGFQHVACAALAPCSSSDNSCPDADQICVRHPRCSSDRPLCYPASMIDPAVCPPVKSSTVPMTTAKPAFVPLRSHGVNIPSNPRWEQNAITVAEGYQLANGSNATNQLYFPMGLFVADDDTFYVTDPNNNRVMELKPGATSGRIIAGGNGRGQALNQLNGPTDVIVDRETDTLIICDNNNKRIVRWPRTFGGSGEIILSNVTCNGLTMDEEGALYAVGYDTDEVKRFRKGETQGTVVAGGNGRGNGTHQLHWPQYVFVDREHTVYVSEWYNGRVMKWVQGAKQGVPVAGGNGQGTDIKQLAGAEGVVVDQMGAVYVAECSNARVVRWAPGATQGTVIAGGQGQGKQANQLSCPYGLSFDRVGNLYVVDHWNHRVQKFNLI